MIQFLKENFVGEKMMEFPENECSIKESIFVENCKNSTLMIKGKVKSIFLSKCVKVNLIFKVKNIKEGYVICIIYRLLFQLLNALIAKILS